MAFHAKVMQVGLIVFVNSATKKVRGSESEAKSRNLLIIYIFRTLATNISTVSCAVHFHFVQVKLSFNCQKHVGAIIEALIFGNSSTNK